MNVRVGSGITLCGAALVFSFVAWGAAGSPIADAAMKGDRTAVRALIAQKADVNAPQLDGATALQWAAYNNDLEMADILIAAGANVKAANREGATSMYLASLEGSAPMMEKLLQAGADANAPGPQGETPLMLASRSGNLDAIGVLLDHKADVNAKEKLRGTTALLWASEQGHAKAMKLLIGHGADFGAASNPDTRNARNNVQIGLQQQFKRNAANQRRKGGQVDDAAAADDDDGAALYSRGPAPTDGGGLTALVYAARQDCLECAKILLDAGADVNQQTHYGWTALLTATQNRHYQLAAYLMERGANTNIANNGGWTPLYLATDNRNIESGDYPVRTPDMDHLDFIKRLLEKGANVNARICGARSTPDACVGDTTETRTNFTMQWLLEDGATPFLRAAQSGDVTLMKLLLAHGADPKIFTAHNVSPLAVAAGIGWVQGITFEWSEQENLEAVRLCLDLGIDANFQDEDGRTALHGAAHKGRPQVIQMLVDHGAQLDIRDLGSRDSRGVNIGKTWIPLDWARGLVRVGVQSAIAQPEAEKLLVKLMTEKGLPIPPPITTSICFTKGVDSCQ
jgi:ankyrin repeat protein